MTNRRKKLAKLVSNRKIAITIIVLLASTAVISSGLSGEEKTESFNRADIMFMNMMIIHHDQAIEMAELAPDRTDNENTLELSRNISEAQREENQQMADWLREEGYTRPRNGHRMAGMASTQQMQELRNSEGKEFDQLFSELMIRHHRGGVQMARSFSQRGENTELIEMEEQMIETQQKEIRMMQEWQKNWV